MFDDVQYFSNCWNKLWENEQNKKLIKNQVKTLLASEDFVMYFKKNGDVYACGEESRLTFARIKNPNDDDMVDLESNFMAVNLTKGLKNNTKVQNIFSNKDVKSIKIISEEEAEKTLISQVKGKVTDAKVEERRGEEK